ncbi:MAG: hypothetical protein PVF33_13260 [Candidatus Latescibacterota bacterium]|jgi:hypothetical protein
MSSCLPAVLTGLACYGFQTGVVGCHAQVPTSNARAVALGQATVALAGVDGVNENPAALAAVDKATASFGFNRLFGLSELTVQSARLAVPLGSAAVSGSFENLGYEAYSVNQLGVALGTVLRSVQVGICAGLALHRFDRYESFSSVRLDAGWIYPLSSFISVGAAATGLAGSRIRTGSLALGAGIVASISNRARLLVSFVQPRGERLDVRIGAEVELAEMVIVRFGGTGLAGFAGFGAGVAVSRVRIDLALSHHPRLGFSPVLTVSLTK